MRHVVVMTTTASVGFLFLFLVDFLTLFYISLLRDVRLVAGVGLASFVQHIVSAVAIGLAVAATALVSRALGARDRTLARSRTTSCLTVSFLTLTVLAALVFVFREEAVGLLMEPGPATEVASRYLAWILPSLPVLGLGISTAAILRAEGDARRALMVTMVAGGVAFVLDPLVILVLGLGVDGAAWVLVLSRIVTALVGLHFVVRTHELAAPLRLAGAFHDFRAIFAVAGPAVLAQLSTPSGFLLLAAWVGRFGDEDLGLLIGRHGAHVAALQYVVNVIVSRALDGNNPVTVDVDGYRRRRETALVEMAQRAAAEVREQGEPVTLGVMPAAERRIIHLQLQDDPELKTESQGEGSSRRVRILYRDD